MSEGFSDPIIGGGGGLVYPSIHSPDYVASASGWTINKDGSAEFANLKIRGTFFGTNWELSNHGFFIYTGTPAAGNPPILSLCPEGTTQDDYGNTALPVLNIGTMAAAHSGFDDQGDFFIVDPSNVVRVSDYTGGNNVNSGEPIRVWTSAAGNTVLNLGFDATSGEILMTVHQDNAANFILHKISPEGYWSYTDDANGDPVGYVVLKAGATDPAFGTAQTSAGFVGTFRAFNPSGSPPQAQETWHAWSPAAGFAAFGAPFASPAYQLEAVNGGRVRLSGVVKLTANQGSGTTIFTLPAGYQPVTSKDLAAANNLSGGLGSPLQVDSSGNVKLNTTGTNGNFVSLDGISFEIDR